MRLHYLQHVPFENPGSILVWANKNGHELTKTEMYLEQPLPKQQEFDWLVIMGGPMNIYEEEKYPWLVEEKKFILEAIKGGKVVIGLCLGAQLIADVLGGKVTRNLDVEIGWHKVKFSEKARKTPHFFGIPEEAKVFQWHEDTFSVLPEQAECIAENTICKNQAFRYGNSVFGFQFHMENTPQIIEDLITNFYHDVTEGPYVQLKSELVAHPEYIELNHKWMSDFLDQLVKIDREEECNGTDKL